MNLVGVHYNCRTIKFDPEQMVSLSLSLFLAVPGAERGVDFFEKRKKRIRSDEADRVRFQSRLNREIKRNLRYNSIGFGTIVNL